MPTIAIYVTWKSLGFYILLYLAALQNVPTELYESAATDGAGKVRQFFSVTVPGRAPATVLVLLLATITGANLFTEPYLLTGGGGPDGHSTSPVLLIYQQGIQQGHPGYASAIGVDPRDRRAHHRLVAEPLRRRERLMTADSTPHRPPTARRPAASGAATSPHRGA